LAARDAESRVPLLPSSELAVTGDAISTIRVDEIAARTAADRVADAVLGAHDVAAGPRDKPVSPAAADENVVAGAAVEEIGAAEAAKHVRPLRPAQNLSA
jgi:hypothetical protein